MIMKGESFAADTSKTGTAPEVIEKIKATPGAIGLAPMGIVLDGVKTPKTPEIGRPISVVTKGAPSAEMQKVFEFIAGEGKKYLPK
jgi:phosphate transport system substrate-binding protein